MYRLLKVVLTSAWLCSYSSVIAAQSLDTLNPVINQYQHRLDDVKNTPVYKNNRIDLALIIWYEARGENPTGMRMVGNVILNRLQLKIWGKTVKDVIYSPKQFQNLYPGSWQRQQLNNLRNKAIHNREVPPELAMALTISSELLIEYALNHRQDNTKGAIFFHRRGIKPANIKSLVNTVNYGNHSFWKLRN